MEAVFTTSSMLFVLGITEMRFRTIERRRGIYFVSAEFFRNADFAETPNFIGALGGIRTPDPQIRSLLLFVFGSFLPHEIVRR
jgi:hypothetical protein